MYVAIVPMQELFFILERNDRSMNKGLEIRNKKLKKKAELRNTIKPEQTDLCRFVELKWEVIEKVNGKYKRTGQARGKGLQVKNRVYLSENHYKMINSKSVHITRIYEDVPEWASDELIQQYTKNQKP